MDTIQLLKDLTSQVNKLKTEHATLIEESHEVIFCMSWYINKLDNFEYATLIEESD